MFKSLAFRTVLAVAAFAMAAPAASAFEITGLYATGEGQLSLYRVEGTTTKWIGEYGDDGGRIEANQIDYDAIVGYWMENSSAVRCDTERGGTYFWGKMNFVWESSMPLPSGAFAGRWSYCDGPSDHEWIGIRLDARG